MTTTGEIVALADAAREYDVARRVALRLKTMRGACLCEVAEPAEPEVGLGATDPCWKQWHYDQHHDEMRRSSQSEWCATCRRRQQLHEAYRQAMQTRGARMRGMQRFARRGIDLRMIEEEVKKIMAENETEQTQAEEKSAEQQDAAKQDAAEDAGKTEDAPKTE